MTIRQRLYGAIFAGGSGLRKSLSRVARDRIECGVVLVAVVVEKN
jgi:hypothetical protein